MDDVVYCTPDECSPSVLSDVSVVLGRRTMDYGPYDPVTHLPSGFYPLFVADFEQEGLHYRAVSHNLTEAEFLDLLRQFVSR